MSVSAASRAVSWAATPRIRVVFSWLFRAGSRPRIRTATTGIRIGSPLVPQISWGRLFFPRRLLTVPRPREVTNTPG
eukprot:5158265-Pyramimonas_sp.AAC.1